MEPDRGIDDTIATRLVAGYEDRDVELLREILADDARWGDDDKRWRCRTREEVLALLARILDRGIGVQVTELVEGRGGLMCRLAITWPDRAVVDQDLYFVYLVQANRIVEIQEHVERRSALDAIS